MISISALHGIITSFCIPHSERLPFIINANMHKDHRKYCNNMGCDLCLLYATRHYHQIVMNHHDKSLNTWSRTYRNRWKELADHVGSDVKSYDYDNKQADDKTFYIYNQNYTDNFNYDILGLFSY